MSVIIKLLSKFDDSGLKKAKSGFSGLTKSLGALGIGLGLKQIAGDLMDAAKAASMDQKSTQLLNSQLQKNAKATQAQTKQNDKFIQSLSEQVGIVDDDLRPAQARLARATGSVAKSQELLRLSLDASTVSGKPLSTVSAAMAKAFNGNTGALTKLFPELKKSKDLFGDLRREVEGAAAQQADPFAKLNVAMDNLKEKLGGIVLPLVVDAIDKMMKPGGLIDSVGKFFDDVANPKTDIGQAFRMFGETVTIAGKDLSAFFALMDPKKKGNSMSGFAASLEWISITLQSVIDGLLVFSGAYDQVIKGNFAEANALMSARTDVGAEAIRNRMTVKDTIAAINAQTISTGRGRLITDTQGGLGGTFDNVITSGTNMKLPESPLIFKPGKAPAPQTYNITINNTAVDPKSATDALGKYIKQNGSLPFNLATVGRG
jgi:hypothetical protein